MNEYEAHLWPVVFVLIRIGEVLEVCSIPQGQCTKKFTVTIAVSSSLYIHEIESKHWECVFRAV